MIEVTHWLNLIVTIDKNYTKIDSHEYKNLLYLQLLVGGDSEMLDTVTIVHMGQRKLTKRVKLTMDRVLLIMKGSSLSLRPPLLGS